MNNVSENKLLDFERKNKTIFILCYNEWVVNNKSKEWWKWMNM